MIRSKIIVVLIIVLVILLSINSVEASSSNINIESVLSFKSDLIEQMFIEFEPIEEVPEEPIYNEEDLYWLSRIISAESKGESMDGQVAVGNVVMNRVSSDEFPNTIKDVVFQKGQFCPVRNGSIYDEPTEQSVESAKSVLDGEVIVEDAIYFYAPKWTSSNNWIRTREIVDRIGVHIFAK